MSEDVDDLFKRAVGLRDESHKLNLAMHSPDVTEGEYHQIAAEKRAIDEKAFALEQRVRELEEADYPADAVTVEVPAAPINGGI